MKSLYNSTDTECLKRAILALEYNDLTDAMLHAEHIYLVAFSLGLGTKASAEECLADFFGGESEYKETHNKLFLSFGVNPDELSLGDLVLFGGAAGARAAIFDGEGLIELGAGRSGNAVKACEIESEERVVTLRPKGALEGFVPSDDRPDESELSGAQRALVMTAEAYLARGYRCQYDDSRFTRCGGGEFRWQIGFRSPEEYTQKAFGYINCAAFTYEVYREALGMDLGALYTTYNYMLHYRTNGFTEGEPARPFYYEITHNETKEEKDSVHDRFCKALKVGDVVVYRRNNGNGHAMLYVGGGKLIHSTGASYNYKEGRETFEPTIRYMNLESSMFSEGTIRYIFAENIETLGIIRPLDLFDGEIPENTASRVNKMNSIFAEKLISGRAYNVNLGDEVEYGIEIKNGSSEMRTVEINTEIPENAEYAGGDLKLSDGVMTKKIKLAPEERVCVSYKLRATGKAGSKISGGGTTINGVLHICPDVLISRVVTRDEGERIKGVVSSDFVSDAVGIELANLVYRSAGVAASIEDSSDIEGALFVAEEFYTLRDNGVYSSYIPEHLYGGRNLQTQNLYSASCKLCSGRVRLPREFDLVIGDVIVVKDKGEIEFYLYSGEESLRILNSRLEIDSMPLGKRLESLPAVHDYFVVLRPKFE